MKHISKGNKVSLFPMKLNYGLYQRHTGLFKATFKILGKQNARLREARDLLLPRLMSGEIDVSTVSAPDARVTEILQPA